MALNTRISVASRDAAVNAITALIGTSGFLDIYDSTQPTDPNTALGAQVKLAHLALSATAFGASSAGVATANAITTAVALATGTASWFTVTTSAGVRIFDGSVAASSANINLNTVSIVINANVSVTSLTFTIPMQGA